MTQSRTARGLAYSAGGSAEGPLLLLLHGLGANSHVFDAMFTSAAKTWPGGWLAPDLPGHGNSAWAPPYTFEGHAAQVAELLDRSRPLVVLGHSMGGVVAVELASGRHAVDVLGVVGLGVKVAWTSEELARAGALAERPQQTFPTRDECVARFLKVAGLVNLVGPDAPVVESGVRRTSEGWQLTMDPRSFGVGSPEMSTRMAAATCPVRLARGEQDPMVTPAQLQALDPDAVELARHGHNAHVEDPDVVLKLAAGLMSP